MTFTPTPRKPTGIPSAPLIMVTGIHKAGKSLTSYKIGRSPRIHRCFTIDLGEGTADEYGALDCYEVVPWGTSRVDLQDTVRWCVAQTCPDGMMNAVIVDSGTETWDGLKNRATARARNSKKNRAELAKDPDFEVDVAMTYWNDAKDTWARIISPLKLSGHVVGVIIVRSDDVAVVDGQGNPTKQRTISYQCEKTLPAMVTAHVDIRPDHRAFLVGVRSLTVSVPPSGLLLDDTNALGQVIDLLSPDGLFQAPSVATPLDDQRDAPADDTPPGGDPRGDTAGLLTIDDLHRLGWHDVPHREAARVESKRVMDLLPAGDASKVRTGLGPPPPLERYTYEVWATRHTVALEAVRARGMDVAGPHAIPPRWEPPAAPAPDAQTDPVDDAADAEWQAAAAALPLEGVTG